MDFENPQKSKNDYTVGWVAALPLELAAACAMLDEEHCPPHDFSQGKGDTNSYEWGRIGEHNIVLASLPSGQFGVTSAATTAQSMVITFPQIRFGLMIGIGGGIPRPDDGIDIRLGDIVVSQPSGQYGGVVQYDMGMAEAGGVFRRIGSLNSPPTVLLKAVTKLRAIHERKGSRVSGILEDALSKNSRMRKPNNNYARPGQEKDRLFKPTYCHVSGKNCNGCDSSEEVVREDREDLDPEIHYGVIGSGNTLVKDPEVRKCIVEELDGECLCFEMEASGLMNEFPCLVIRGISDYSDSHKNYNWQRYAAIIAAAYAKELLGVMRGCDVEEEQKAASVLKSVAQSVDRINKTVDEITSDTHRRAIRAWLSPPDPSTNHNIAAELRHGSTGGWFIGSDVYLRWKTSPQSSLWLNGKPGSGKTILASTVIGDLRKQESDSSSLLYFYFSFSDASKQKFEQMIRSLTWQLYCKQLNTRHLLDSLFEENKKGENQPNIDSMCSVFNNMLYNTSEVWIVLDALDESEVSQTRSRWNLFSWIQWLGKVQTKRHLFITSRQQQEIESKLRGSIKDDENISLHNSSVDTDIHDYVKARVATDLARWNSRPELQCEIEKALTNKADGMFRWVSCQIDTLQNCFMAPLVHKALRSLPKDLGETYSRILDRIPEDHRPYTTRILQFLAFSKRPMKRGELVDALAVDLARRPRFQPHDRMPEPEEITRFCPSLVTTTRENNDAKGDIQLAHFSVKEWLVSGQAQGECATTFIEAIAHSGIANTCVAYMLDLEYDNLQHISLEEHQSLTYIDQVEAIEEAQNLNINQIYPLVDYAVEFWGVHAAAAEVGGVMEAIPITMELFGSEKAHRFKKFLFKELDRRRRAEFPDRTWGHLYYACYFGLLGAASKLIETGANVNADNDDLADRLLLPSFEPANTFIKSGANVNADSGDLGYGLGLPPRVLLSNHSAGKPLGAACEGGHLKIVELLIHKGANVNVVSTAHCQTPLEIATMRGHTEIVYLLVQSGAKIYLDEFGAVLLYSAASNGNEALIDFFIAESQGAFLKEPLGTNALECALSNSQEGAFLLLISRGAGARVNDRRSRFLEKAIKQGNKSILRELLDRGTDVDDVLDSDHGTPLYYAVILNNEDIVRLLLDKGASVSAQGGYYGDPLRASASLDNVEIMKLLLDYGADIDAQLGKCLLIAAGKGATNTVQFLLSHDANTNTQCMRDGSVLQEAVKSENIETLQALLNNGANVNAKGGQYGSALQAAASQQRGTEIVQILLDYGAKVNAKGGKYGSALQAAANPWGGSEIVQILIDHGANVNAKGGMHGSALQAAANPWGEPEIVQILLKYGADVNAPGGFYGNPLQAAARFGLNRIMKLLLKRGANVNARGGTYGTALHAAAAFGSPETMEILLKNGADMNTRVKPYGSLLHAAATEFQYANFQFLLEHGAKPLSRQVVYSKSSHNSGPPQKDMKLFLKKENIAQARARMGQNIKISPADFGDDGYEDDSSGNEDDSSGTEIGQDDTEDDEHDLMQDYEATEYEYEHFMR